MIKMILLSALIVLVGAKFAKAECPDDDLVNQTIQDAESSKDFDARLADMGWKLDQIGTTQNFHIRFWSHFRDATREAPLKLTTHAHGARLKDCIYTSKVKNYHHVSVRIEAK